jgi:undecaprenyl-diphosphatase
MIRTIEHIDQQFFLWLNSFNSPFFDWLMHGISGTVIWIPLYLAILIYLGKTNRRKFLVIIIFVIVAATLSDQFSVIVKNLVHRFRPCHEPALAGLVHTYKGQCGGLYSFVSSHACNSFDVALLSLSFIKKRWYSFSILLWASVVGYSRIYLGVHYPADVICGAMLGSLIGWGVYNLYAITDNKILKHKKYFSLQQVS